MDSSECPSWMDSQGITKSKCILMMKNIPLSGHHWGYTATPSCPAGATYQRAMNAIFHEHMRKTVECYVDDIAVKSRAKGNHIANLKAIFDIMRTHQLKMNPTKSFLGVASGKFLRFVVTSKGIHLDPEKVPLSRRCNLQKVLVSYIWDDACQQAFEKIKGYFTHPPVLTAPVSEKPYLS